MGRYRRYQNGQRRAGQVFDTQAGVWVAASSVSAADLTDSVTDTHVTDLGTGGDSGLDYSDAAHGTDAGGGGDIGGGDF